MLTDLHAKGRGSPTCSPVVSDNKDSDDDDYESSDEDSVSITLVAI